MAPTARPTLGLDEFDLPKVTTILGPVSPSNTSNTAFGDSVALSRNGQVLAVGAPRYGEGAGQVRVLLASKDDTWEEHAVLNGAHSTDSFGSDIALSEDGSILAVGASGSNTVYTYAFHPNLNGGQGGYDLIGDPIREEDSRGSFGHSISLSTDGFRLVVGAPYASTGKVRNGQVRVYFLDGNAWTQMGQSLVGGDNIDWLGSAVDISGDGHLVIASAPRNREHSGYVRTWTFNQQMWEQVGTDITNTVEPTYTSDRFGHSIALSVGEGKPRVAIGCPWKVVAGKLDAGMVLVYEFNDTNWYQLGSAITQRIPRSRTEVGNAVDLDGGILTVGIPGFNETGAVALYRWLDGNWVERSEMIYGENDRDNFGVSLASRRDPPTDGFALVVGALGNAGYVASYVKQDY